MGLIKNGEVSCRQKFFGRSGTNIESQTKYLQSTVTPTVISKVSHSVSINLATKVKISKMGVSNTKTFK